MRHFLLLPLLFVFSLSNFAFGWDEPVEFHLLVDAIDAGYRQYEGGGVLEGDAKEKISRVLALSPEKLKRAAAHLFVVRKDHEANRQLARALMKIGVWTDDDNGADEIGFLELIARLQVSYTPLHGKPEHPEDAALIQAALGKAAYSNYAAVVSPYTDDVFNNQKILDQKVEKFKKRFYRFHAAYVGIILVSASALAAKYFNIEIHDAKDVLLYGAAAYKPVEIFFKKIWPHLKNERLKRKFKRDYEAVVASIKEFALLDPVRTIPYIMEVATEEGEANLFEEAAYEALKQIDIKEAREALLVLALRSLERGDVKRAAETAKFIFSLQDQPELKALAVLIQEASDLREDLHAAAKKIRRKYILKGVRFATYLVGGTAAAVSLAVQLGYLDASLVVALKAFVADTVGFIPIVNVLKARFAEELKANLPREIAETLESFENALFRMCEANEQMIPILGAMMRSTDKLEEFERIAAERAMIRLAPRKIAIDEMKYTSRYNLRKDRFKDAERQKNNAIAMSQVIDSCATTVAAKYFPTRADRMAVSGGL